MAFGWEHLPRETVGDAHADRLGLVTVCAGGDYADPGPGYRLAVLGVKRGLIPNREGIPKLTGGIGSAAFGGDLGQCLVRAVGISK
jgi:hypothetical protein